MTRSMVCMLGLAITMIMVAYGDVPDCSDVIGKLTPCLSYIQMQVAEPSSDCCKGLSYAHTSKPVCLCQILDSQSSSSSGSGLNTSAAMMLPTMCKVNADAKRCPALLGQSAAAPEAHKSNASNHVPSAAATATKGTTQSNSSLQLVPCALLFVALALLQHFV